MSTTDKELTEAIKLAALQLCVALNNAGHAGLILDSMRFEPTSSSIGPNYLKQTDWRFLGSIYRKTYF